MFKVGDPAIPWIPPADEPIDFEPTTPELILRLRCDGERFEVDTFVNGRVRFHGVFSDRADAWDAAEHALLSEMAASDNAATFDNESEEA